MVKNIYKLLSLALQWPDEQWMSTMRHALQMEHDMLPVLGDAFTELALVPLEHIQAEYTNLFMNGFPTTPCPPYESHYCKSETVWEEVVVFYRRWGLTSKREQPEHIAVELEFMHVLLSALETATDEEERSEVQVAVEAFGSKHLGRWAERFARDLVTHARLAFYRILGEVLAEFVQLERMRWKKSEALNPHGVESPQEHSEYNTNLKS